MYLFFCIVKKEYSILFKAYFCGVQLLQNLLAIHSQVKYLDQKKAISQTQISSLFDRVLSSWPKITIIFVYLAAWRKKTAASKANFLKIKAKASKIAQA